MKEYPILFSAPMVRAILDGRKHVTRRIVKNEFGVCGECWTNAREPMCVPHNDGDGGMGIFGTAPYLRVAFCEHNDRCGGRTRCPYGRTEDRLWVKETWAHDGSANKGPSGCWYRADPCKRDFPGVPCEHGPARWTPSIYMPRWASRITLEVTGVRVERLQDITPADAVDEGAAELLRPGHPLRASVYERFGTVERDGDLYAGAVDAFATLWDSINRNRAPWSSNPWVWVVAFKRVIP